MSNSKETRSKSDAYLISSYSTSFVNTVQAMINKSFAIDFGIIKDIPANGIVTVETSVAKESKDIVIVTCVLAGLSSDNLTVNVKPIIGDKVIVLYPRRYDNKMFDVESKEPIIKDTASGYNVFSGIAFLANQCKTKSYKNIITANEGTVDIKLGYNKDEDKNYFNFSTTKEGDINFNNPKANFSIDKDGNITLKAGEKEGTTVTLKADKSSSITNGTANIEIKADNSINITNGNAKIEMGTDNSVKINNHLKVTI